MLHLLKIRLARTHQHTLCQQLARSGFVSAASTLLDAAWAGALLARVEPYPLASLNYNLYAGCLEGQWHGGCHVTEVHRLLQATSAAPAHCAKPHTVIESRLGVFYHAVAKHSTTPKMHMLYQSAQQGA